MGSNRGSMRAPGTAIAALLVWAWIASPATGLAQPASPPPDDDIPLEVVPLVDMNAPLVVAWFSESNDVALDDASKAENQVLEEIAKRIDLRVFSREKTLSLVSNSGDPALQRCNWQTACLIAIGRLADADRVIGVKMSGTPQQYYLAFKRLDLHKDPVTEATHLVSGSLSNLMMSGAAQALEELLAAEGQALVADATPTPVEPAAAPAPAEPTTPAEPPAPTEPASAANQPTEPPSAPKANVVPPEPADEQPTLVARPGFFRRHLGSTIALGAGVVAAGIGIGFGIMAGQIESDMGFQYDPARDGDGRDDALTANVMLGLAGAAAVTALILFLVEPDADGSEVSVVPSAGGALVRF